MDNETFKKLIRYYLSCIDAEDAMSLQLRKNQEYESYIFIDDAKEKLFSDGLAELEVSITDKNQRSFINRKSASAEALADLYYGFPLFKDTKDILSPLFFVEADVSFTDSGSLHVLPRLSSITINRRHFVEGLSSEEVQRICDELEGEFGSFDARLSAAREYMASTLEGVRGEWIEKPILFRSNHGGMKKGLRFDLAGLLSKEGAHKEDTALQYLFEKNLKKIDVLEKNQPPILEVGLLNDQQEQAVLNGLTEPLSVVTGPPGTGKTQVVTTLLASAAYNEKSVLFASNNNMPVDGVYERLGQSTGVFGNWLMRLGNKEKTRDCNTDISSLLELLQTSNLSEFQIDEEQQELSNIDFEILKAHSSFKQAIKLQGEISDLHKKEKLLVHKLPEAWLNQFSNKDPDFLDNGLVEKLSSLSKTGFILWLRQKLTSVASFRKKHNHILTTLCDGEASLLGYKEFLLCDEAWDDAVKVSRETANLIATHQRWSNCVKRRRVLENKMAGHATTRDIIELKKKKLRISHVLLGKWWGKNIEGRVKQAIEATNTYFKEINNYDSGRSRRLQKSIITLKDFFPIWLVTNQSANSVMPLKAGLYDLVVIDEAGQCDIPSVLPLLYRAKHAVIIGDPHQFKHITQLKDKLESDIAKSAGIDEIADDWSFTRYSIFDRCYMSASATSFLKQHYRCHPNIIEFSNLNFYQGQLVEQVALSHFKNRLPIEEHGLIWRNVSGKAEKAKKGAWNPYEVRAIIEQFEAWNKKGLFADPDLSYGVVTPFRMQAFEVRKALWNCDWFQGVRGRFTVGTAHSFQGSECDVLLYSPVVSNGLDDYLVRFAASQEELINVSVTRAKNLLYIVGNMDACLAAPKDTPLYKLAAYAEMIRRQNKHPQNPIERKMSTLLEELELNYVPQYEFGEYRLDFLVNSHSGERYNVEVDGDIHLTASAIEHDERRDAFVKSKGLKILRFSARDVSYRPSLVKERLSRI